MQKMTRFVKSEVGGGVVGEDGGRGLSRKRRQEGKMERIVLRTRGAEGRRRSPA